jgi:hypothetical protein
MTGADETIALVSFADRTMRGSLRRLDREARAMGVFSHRFLSTDRDLDAEFWTRHREFILRHPRLFGYDIWKPHIVQRALAGLPAGAILFYCDAGCSLNPEGVARFREYLAMARAHPSGSLAFTGGLPEVEWTKRDVLDRLGFTAPEQLESSQVWGGMFFLVKMPATVRLVERWSELTQEYHLVDDSASEKPEHPRFREHRHDQSIFSILFKEAGGLAIPDETWWPGTWQTHRQYPIHARRWKHWRNRTREQFDLADSSRGLLARVARVSLRNGLLRRWIYRRPVSDRRERE